MLFQLPSTRTKFGTFYVTCYGFLIAFIIALLSNSSRGEDCPTISVTSPYQLTSDPLSSSTLLPYVQHTGGNSEPLAILLPGDKLNDLQRSILADILHQAVRTRLSQYTNNLCNIVRINAEPAAYDVQLYSLRLSSKEVRQICLKSLIGALSDENFSEPEFNAAVSLAAYDADFYNLTPNKIDLNRLLTNFRAVSRRIYKKGSLPGKIKSANRQDYFVISLGDFRSWFAQLRIQSKLFIFSSDVESIRAAEASICLLALRPRLAIDDNMRQPTRVSASTDSQSAFVIITLMDLSKKSEFDEIWRKWCYRKSDRPVQIDDLGTTKCATIRTFENDQWLVIITKGSITDKHDLIGSLERTSAVIYSWSSTELTVEETMLE